MVEFTSAPEITQNAIRPDDLFVMRRDASANVVGSRLRSLRFSSMSAAVIAAGLSPVVKELVTLTGSEFLTAIDPETGGIAKIRIDSISPDADHRNSSRFKDRNYGPFSSLVLDNMSDGTADYVGAPNNDPTNAVNVASNAVGVTVTRGSYYRLTKARLGGDVTIVTDPKNVFGNRSVKMKSGVRPVGAAVAADYTIYRRDDFGATLNLTGKGLRLDLRSSNPSNIDEITVSFGNNNMANFYRFNNVLGDQATRPMLFGNRTRISFPLNVVLNGDPLIAAPGYNEQSSGAPNIATVNSIQIRLLGKEAVQADVDLYRVASVEMPKATVALVMDDGYETWYSIARNILERYGVRGSIAGIQRYHDPLHPNYVAGNDGVPGFGNRLSEAQIRTMIEAGHELAYHETGNDMRADFSPQEVENAILSYKAWTKRVFDYEVKMGVYPGGEHGYFQAPGDAGSNPAKTLWGTFAAKVKPDGSPVNLKPDGTAFASDAEVTVRDVFAKHFKFSRSIILNTAETDPATDNHLLRTFLYQFGPSYRPSSGAQLGIRSGHPNYGGKATLTHFTGAAAAGSATGTLVFGATGSGVDDAYTDKMVVITSGTGAGQVKFITDYVGATKTANVFPAAWATLPDATSVLKVYTSQNMHIVNTIIAGGGVAVASYHDLFVPSGNEQLIVNQAGFPTEWFPTNPYASGGSPLNTQSSATDLEFLLFYLSRRQTQVDVMPLREAFTRKVQ
jgi:hypothetical protein